MRGCARYRELRRLLLSVNRRYERHWTRVEIDMVCGFASERPPEVTDEVCALIRANPGKVSFMEIMVTVFSGSRQVVFAV